MKKLMLFIIIVLLAYIVLTSKSGTGIISNPCDQPYADCNGDGQSDNMPNNFCNPDGNNYGVPQTACRPWPSKSQTFFDNLFEKLRGD